MSQISLKSISGITSITTPAGVDNVFTVHTNDTTEKLRIDQTGNQNISGIVTASNFKTGSSNLHSAGVEVAGVNVQGGDTPVGLGATIYNSGAAVFTGVVTATSYYGDGSNLTGIAADKIFEGNTEVETVDTGSNGHIKFTTEGGERLRITSDGSFGFNNNNPQYTIDIVGNQINLKSNASDSNAVLRLRGENNSRGGAIVAMNGSGGAGPLEFWTGSSQRLSITTAGRVQIASGGDLYIVGSSYNAKLTGNILDFDRAGYSYIQNSSNSGSLNFRVTASNTIALRLDDAAQALFPQGVILLGTQNTSSGHINAYENMSFNIDTDNDDTNRYFSFHKNGMSASGTELLRITEDGQIHKRQDSTNRTSLKTYSGEGLWFDHYQYQSSGTYRRYADIASVGDGAWGSLIRFHTMPDNGSPTERLYIDQNGSVIVANGRLHASRVQAKFGIDCHGLDIFDGVGTVANYGMVFYNDPNTNKANGIGFFNDDGQTCGGYIVHQDKGGSNIGDILFATSATAGNPVQRLRISSTGIFGINNNGNRTLHVQTSNDHGNIGVFAGENINSSNAATVFFLSTYRNENSNEYFMQFNKDQDNNGDGVAAVYRVNTRGDVKNKYNSYSGISDVKLKENIVDANSQWDDIKAIKVRNFNFKTNPDTKLLGVVAQEIETVSAGLVEDTPDKDITKQGDEGTTTKSVKYSILYMKAIKCLQEAQARIETLEAKVSTLEGS